MAAWRGLTANLTGVEQPRRLNVRHVTWELFSIFGVRPIIGRDFTPDDDRPGVPRTALVSYAFWQRELGGTPGALGRQIMLDETPVTVIGVLPRDFTIARQEDAFLPVGTFLQGPVLQMYNGRGNHFGFSALGRLKPGVTLETASAEMVTIARQLEQEYPATNSGNGASVEPLFEVLVADARQMLYVLFGAVITMLLIACVNLANLMLSRAAGRAQEMAVRRSLGAARWRLARQMLTESLLLAAIGGTLGVLVAYVGFEALVALLPPDQPRIHIVTIDWRVVAVAALASIGTGVLFGLMPAIQAATGRSMTLLRSARVTGTAQTQRRHASDAAAGRSRARARARHRRRADAADDEQSARRGDRVSSPGDRLGTVQPAAALRPRQAGPVSSIRRWSGCARFPACRTPSFTYSIPLAGSNWNSIFIIEGQPVPERSKLPSSAWTPITSEYFDTMGIRLLKGRGFDSRDVNNSPTVIVVNETFARRFFGANNPIGARVKQGWPEDKSPMARNRRRRERRARRPACRVIRRCRHTCPSGRSRRDRGRSWSGRPSTRPRSGAPSKPPFTRSIRTCRSSTCRR